MTSIILIACIAVGSCFATPTLIILCLIALYSLYIVYVRHKYKNIPNPPFRNFFLANGEEMMISKRNRHLLWITWDKAHGPLFKICAFHKVFIMATSSDLAKTLCLNSNYPKAKKSYVALQKLHGIKFMGRGLVTEFNHAIWREHRTVVNPAFYKSYLKNMLLIFDNHCLKLVETLKRVSEEDKSGLSLLEYVSRVTMDIICEVGFSFDSKCIDDKDSPFPIALYTVLRAISKSFDDPFFNYKPWNWKEIKRRKKSLLLLRETGKNIIKNKVEKFTSEDFVSKDILDVILQNRKETDISDEILIDDFITLFVAGQETTSNSIAFLFYLLSNNLDIKRKAQQEADDFFDLNSKITYDSLKELPYIEACWREGLRLFPPAYATVREIPKGLENLAGYKLPVGTDVVINFIPIHYNNCPDGATFNPDRLLAGNDAKYSNIPFSIGQRSCIGRFFAEFEAKIIIARLLHNFDFQMTLDQTFDIDEALTMRLRDGCKVKLISRS